MDIHEAIWIVLNAHERSCKYVVEVGCCGRVSIASSRAATESLLQCSDLWTEEIYFYTILVDLNSYLKMRVLCIFAKIWLTVSFNEFRKYLGGMME